MDTTFERTTGKEDWLTPPSLIKALGEFDLDPCAAINQPWPTAKKQYTILDNGLMQKWEGRVWCNPPYSTKAELFINKLKNHGNGIALIFARVETKNWFENIWAGADAVFFIKGRIRFFDINGKESGSAGAASALIAYGLNNVEALKNSGLKGKLILLR